MSPAARSGQGAGAPGRTRRENARGRDSRRTGPSGAWPAHLVASRRSSSICFFSSSLASVRAAVCSLSNCKDFRRREREAMRRRAPQPLRPVPRITPGLHGWVLGRPGSCLCPEHWREHARRGGSSGGRAAGHGSLASPSIHGDRLNCLASPAAPSLPRAHGHATAGVAIRPGFRQLLLRYLCP